MFDAMLNDRQRSLRDEVRDFVKSVPRQLILEILKYRAKEVLLAKFGNVILEPAWEMHLKLQRKKNEQLEAISIEEMIERKQKSVP
jgi:hypothetical protein